MFLTMQQGLDKQIKAETNPLHDRIGRIRDEYVRRDDLDAHLARMEKQFDEIRAEMRRGSESLDKRLAEMVAVLRKDH